MPTPDFTLGDFNVTEDAIDRMPPRLDDDAAITALRDVRHGWNIQDAWREANPTERAFTFRAQTHNEHIKARLDRIYVAERIKQNTFGWEITESAIPSDHSMVLIRYAPKDAPFIGKGRWTLPLHLLNNESLMTKIETQGREFLSNATRIRLEQIDRRVENIQTLWETYNENIKELTKETAKETHHKIISRIKALEKDIKATNRNPDIIRDNDLRAHEAFLNSQLKQLKKKRSKNRTDIMKANLSNHGEKLGGIWSALGKERRPRNPIHRLKIPGSNPPQYERHSKRMAELARNHHDTLQNEDVTPGIDPNVFEEKLNDLLQHIPANQRLEEPERTKMNWKVTEDQVRKALHLSKDGSATGLNGIPYELWKTLQKRHDKSKHENNQNFDVTKALTYVFRDIQEHGVDERTEFTTGWMCPLFKKKDPTDIRNYRPITLMNADYKLLTKVMAIQLMDHAHQLIYPDQAGFIPNRSIFDHIRLAKAILNYMEVTEENGSILALDQEKAYNKIRHDYLWRTLEAFNLPAPFIGTIKALYQNARTRVAINGVLSEPFQVRQGVRQGDPLSCPLFDIAIEPLACRIRADQSIKGITIPGIESPIKIKLFADDMNLLLNKDDRLDHIQRVLNEWCEVSGARFNIEKTEIILMGNIRHREDVVESRKINQEDDTQLPNDIRIAQDGDTVRILGAWIGNKADDVAPWEPILNIIKTKLQIWEKAHPTLNGKRLIIQAIIGGHTQFLAKAQGMPPTIVKALNKLIKGFIWGQGTKPRILMATLQRPISEGGLNLLDIESRNDAIEIIWLKVYLNFTTSRQQWATVTDHILFAAAPKYPVEDMRDNLFLQAWSIPLQGPRGSKLNDDVRRMIKTANKYHVNMDAIRITPHLLNQLPAWYHLHEEEHRPMNSAQARCMRHKHNVAKVSDLMKLSARIRHPLQFPTHRTNRDCECHECMMDRGKGCRDPQRCAEEALTRINLIPPKYNPMRQDVPDGLSLTKSGTQRNRTARENDDEVTFDASITCKVDLAECFRIFMDPTKTTNLLARRYRHQGPIPRCRQITVYTDGACMNNGKQNAKSGSGIWFARDSPRNLALRIPGDTQSNQVGELAAVIAAAASTAPYQPLKIVTDSKYVIEGLTTNLQ